ncbi:SPOR domain-containing protein [Thalassotalea crassostreae]|uniref:SPOR domain-containing protein n=1 Tax=Thalassotalea crassostreae TaxID=1763536 RepID=UPI000838FDFC|nr:SPOR domain-containing protein [Thalassotalea crassostreae]
MAHQDYISRPRTTKKKKNPYQKKAKGKKATPQNGMKAMINIFTIVAIIAAVVWALTSLRANKPDDVTVPEIELTPAETTKPKTKSSDLPEPPEDKWTYDDILEEREVSVEGTYETKSKGPQKLQCGSFRTSAKAEELKAKIAFSGLSSQVRKSNGKNGVWYKVVLGPYENKRGAEKAKHKLRANQINYCKIYPWT